MPLVEQLTPVGTAAVRVVVSNSQRRGWHVEGTGDTVQLRWGPTNAVTLAGGAEIPVGPGAGWEEDLDDEDDPVTYLGDVWVIAASNTTVYSWERT